MRTTLNPGLGPLVSGGLLFQQLERWAEPARLRPLEREKPAVVEVGLTAKYTGRIPNLRAEPSQRVTACQEKLPSVGIYREVNRAFELDKMGRHQDALGIYEKIEAQVLAAQDAKSAAVYYNRVGLCLHHLGRDSAATLACSRALELRPNYGAAHYNLCTIALRSGNEQAAISHLEQALNLDGPYFRKLATEDPDFNGFRDGLFGIMLQLIPAPATVRGAPQLRSSSIEEDLGALSRHQGRSSG